MSVFLLALVSIPIVDHLQTQAADRLAQTERAHLRMLADAQQTYQQQNGSYAQTLSSLELVDPRIGGWQHQDSWKLGAADGRGFIISFAAAAGGKSISYGLKYDAGHYTTTCDAPEHTGCLNGHWKFQDGRYG